MNKGIIIRRTTCTIIAIALLACISPLGIAHAATHSFKDVNETNYFYKEVTEMYEQGAISGYGDGTFLPENPVSQAEALKLVCAKAGVSFVGFSGKTEPWYSDVMAWAQKKGIVSADINPNEAATREEICGYVVDVFNFSTDTYTDAFSDTDSAVANTLFDLGVISGIPNSDGSISFGGSQKVKRCDVCIMLCRLDNVAQESTTGVGTVSTSTILQTYVLDRSHYEVSKPASLSDFDDFVSAWCYMLTNADTSESFSLSMTCTKSQLLGIMSSVQDAFAFASFDYMEYYSFLNKSKVTAKYNEDENGNCINPTITLRLSNSLGLSESAITSEIAAFNETCAAVVMNLYSEGSLKSSMSVKEKAYVLYKYLARHTQYDTSYKFYNGYDAAVRGTAVCQGYTAMYNYLCNLAGVPMEAMTGKVGSNGHAWSRIYSDGTWHNIDTTWSDPVSNDASFCDDTWFWVSDGFLKSAGKPRTFDCDTLIYGQ